MRFIKNLLVGILTVVILASSASAAVTNPSYFKPSGSGLVPSTPFNELGTVSNPWAAIYATILNAVGIAMGGNLDMNGYDIVDVDALYGYGDGVRIDDVITLIPTADQARANDSAVDCNRSITRVVGDGAAVILDTNPAVADGLSDGQLCIIQGTSDTNTVQIVDNNNVQLSGDVSFTLAQGNTLTMVWDDGDSTWYEVARSAN